MKNSFWCAIKFILIVFIGIFLAVICNRFLDYPVSQWFCVNRFNERKVYNFDEVDLHDARVKTNVSDDGQNGTEVIERDLPNSAKRKLPHKLVESILMFEFFGHVLCFFVVVLVCFLLDVRSGGWLIRFIFCVISSQAVVYAIKTLVHRKRPIINDFSLSSFDFSGFVGREDIHSMPSGHTALAFMMAFVLAQRYPRGKYLFYVLAFLVAFQRLFDCRHYLSDTVVGGLISFVIFCLCYKVGFIARQFEQIEKKYDKDKSDEKNFCKNNDDSAVNKQPVLIDSPALGATSGGKRSGIRSGTHSFDKSQEYQYQNWQERNPTLVEPPNTNDTNKKDKIETEKNDTTTKPEPDELRKIKQRRHNDTPFNKFSY